MLILLLWSCGGENAKSGTGSVQDNLPPIVEIQSPMNGEHFDEYASVTFAAQILDDFSSPSEMTVVWEDGNEEVLFSEALADDGTINFSKDGLSPGAHTFTLFATDLEGMASSDETTIMIVDQVDEPTITILEPQNSLLPYGEDIEFAVMVSDGQTPSSDLSLSYSSSIDGEICTPTPDTTGFASCFYQLDMGMHTLTYSAKDEHGYTSEATQEIEIRDREDIDDDGDGFTENEGDCDDGNPLTNPDADESCDFLDNNCNGSIDENSIDGSTFYADLDGDGYGNPSQSTILCSPEDGYVYNDMDCNDEEPLAWTDNVEACDDVDNNCDGEIDEGLLITFYLDNDGDERGNPDIYLEACTMPEGYIDNADDCNDEEPLAWTGHWEFCGDEVDNDCNGAIDEGGLGCSTYFEDQDEDGYGTSNSQCLCAPEGDYTSTSSTDCNDNDPAVYPGVAYHDSTSACMQDRDGDGYGASSVNYPMTAGTDCNDYQWRVFPGQTQYFTSHRGDGSFDYDCDGMVEKEFDIVWNGITITQGWEWSVPDCGEIHSWCHGALLMASCATWGWRTYPNAAQRYNGLYAQSCR